jgi:hypothetical protein
MAALVSKRAGARAGLTAAATAALIVGPYAGVAVAADPLSAVKATCCGYTAAAGAQVTDNGSTDTWRFQFANEGGGSNVCNYRGLRNFVSESDSSSFTDSQASSLHNFCNPDNTVTFSDATHGEGWDLAMKWQSNHTNDQYMLIGVLDH